MVKEKTQQEDVQNVGEMLRNARLKRGETIADVANKLCIRKNYITAIENMDYNNIPPVPYGVGFIRSYAQYLGLSGDRIVSSYRQFMTEENEGSNTINPENIETTKPHFKHIFIGLCGLALLFIAWSVMPVSEPVEEFREETASVIPEPIIVDSEADAELMAKLRAEDIKDGEEIIEAENPQDVEVAETVNGVENTTNMEEISEVKPVEEVVATDTMKIMVVGPTWLELKQGEKVLIAGKIYDNGFEYEVPNEDGLSVTVGRPHNVKFMVNGEEIPVVSVMKRKNVSLDEFMPQKNRE